MGATRFSEEMLLHLMQNDLNIQAIFTLPERFNISYSADKLKNYNYADLSYIAHDHSTPLYTVDSVPGKKTADYYSVIHDLSPDIILVLGWYYMVPGKIRALAKKGAWGIHASLLPKYAGGAPLVWAMINGEKETGVTLFRFDDGVDDGDIIAQKAFPIDFTDTIREVYGKATEASKYILDNSLRDIDNIRFIPQDKTKVEVYPQRKPEDGLIDWNKSTLETYNFIRAQTRPYPGAYCFYKGNKLTVWDANIHQSGDYTKSGHGTVVDVNNEDGYIIIATGDGYIKVNDVKYGRFEGKPHNIIKTDGALLS